MLRRAALVAFTLFALAKGRYGAQHAASRTRHPATQHEQSQQLTFDDLCSIQELMFDKLDQLEKTDPIQYQQLKSKLQMIDQVTNRKPNGWFLKELLGFGAHGLTWLASPKTRDKENPVEKLLRNCGFNQPKRHGMIVLRRNRRDRPPESASRGAEQRTTIYSSETSRSSDLTGLPRRSVRPGEFWEEGGPLYGIRKAAQGVLDKLRHIERSQPEFKSDLPDETREATSLARQKFPCSDNVIKQVAIAVALVASSGIVFVAICTCHSDPPPRKEPFLADR